MKVLMMTIVPRRLSRWMAAWLLACVAPLAAACTAAETGGALTAVTSQRVKDGAGITGNGAFTFTCNSVVLALLTGTPSLKATLQPSVSGLTLKSGANSIPYTISSTPGGGAYTGGLLVVNLTGVNVVSLLTGAGGNVPIYITTSPGANLPAGTYTDTIQLTWTYQNICEGLASIAGLCLGVNNNGTAVRSLTISLKVDNDCTITAPPVNFGIAPMLSGFSTVSQNLSFTCTKGMVYTVGLSAGSYSTGSRRRMANGANRMEYDIFKADNTVWGSAGTARANGPAAADGTSVQTIPYTARIYTDQTAPAAGTYTDNVVVDVSF
jgi:spore coat protein U-like protein